MANIVTLLPYFALATIILIGNLLVCYLFFSTRSLRNVTNKFVVSSAFCDILIAVVFVPFYVAKSGIKNFEGAGYVASLAAFCSIFNLVALTYDRAVAIFRGLRYIEIMHKTRVRLILAMVWLVSLVICVLPLSWRNLPESKGKVAKRIYQGILTFILIVLNLCIFVVYVRIFKINHHHLSITYKQTSAVSKSFYDDSPSDNVEVPAVSPRRDTNSLFVVKKELKPPPRKRASSTKSLSLVAEIKAARVIAVIFFVNCICWLPVIIINVCDITSKDGLATYLPDDFIDASQYSFVINSAVNPFIYAFCKKDFRRVIKRKLAMRNFR